ncbi:uncharacterized protein C8A04DRAFT_11874 [Dichotomopilus funicola]|uniref:Methyltransferase n=1 Tax=Dichotomopilus funicola TaxID=1934379 RepID=A0AAN6V2Z0_9PEZI|nr:hypothetical protein C8A04DRAFT_11874 [Dichotomopilus funicola]
MTTTGEFRYLDPASIAPGTKPWTKVDGGGTSFTLTPRDRTVHNIRPHLNNPSTTTHHGNFGTDIDVAGFAVYHAPAQEKDFTSEDAVRTGYYAEVEALLRAKLPGRVARVEIFDHTIRKHDPTSPRQPVRQVHVDQTPRAAEVRVRRHVTDLAEPELSALLKRRFQLINVWRPIGHAATDFPLAVVDWRTTTPAELVPVDLLYPLRNREDGSNDDRGKEQLPDPNHVGSKSTEGYEVKGETYGVLPKEGDDGEREGGHKFWYVKDMTPDEAMFIKCFDSWGEGKEGGKKGIAALTPHTAFIDPDTPEGVKGRHSIEVRCLVFYDE